MTTIASLTTARREALPTIREVEQWDREHRRECVERHCTLAHRMLEFADWYIVIGSEVNKRLAALAEREAALTAVFDRLQNFVAETDPALLDAFWFTEHNTAQRIRDARAALRTPQP